MAIRAAKIKQLAHAHGFELAGIAAAAPSEDYSRFEAWRSAGHAAEMRYLTDYRGDLRADPRKLLPTARSILCVAKLYNTPHQATTDASQGRISRYAWGADYHELLRPPLDRLLAEIKQLHGEPLEAKICVDTAPLLERSYARAAGIGWIGKNTCLINQQQGSWFFLAEILLSIPLVSDAPPPNRCGTCRRCIDACPTAAIVQNQEAQWIVDSRLCISYMTIENRGATPGELAPHIGNHVLGCDICQDVCPWNAKAPVTSDADFGPSDDSLQLDRLAALTEQEFRTMFRHSPVWRSKYRGFLRNVAIAMGNSKDPAMRQPLENLAQNPDQLVSSAAQSALRLLACCLLLLLAAVTAQARPADVQVSPGYDHFYNNEFDEALQDFESELKARPADPEMYNHVAQGILYREMLRSGALESQLVSGNNPFLRRPKMEISAHDKQRFDYCFNQAILLGQGQLSKNPKDMDALSALTVAHGLRSNYLFLVEKSWMESLREATAARKADERIRELSPKDIDARLVFGLNEYIVGSLPFYMRALGFLGGFHGDRADGIKQLEIVSSEGARNRYDAKVLLAVIYRRERDPRKAIPLLKELAARFPRNHLFRLEQVQMYSDAGDKQSALAVLDEIERLRHAKAPGYGGLSEEKILYFRANLLFWYNDLGAALADLRQVTSKAGDLDLNTAVLAWLRLGQVDDLQGNHGDAIAAYRLAINMAPRSEAAAEAKGYMQTPYHRKNSAI